MKKLSALILFAAALTFSAPAQNLILNGSIEDNVAAGNISDLTGNWSIYVSDSWEVDGGTMDLIYTDPCGTPSDGNWFVRTSPQSGVWPYLALSLKLSGALTAGAQYSISFDKKYCGPNTSPIDIGISGDSTLLGTVIHTFDAPLINIWASESYTFTAPSAAQYITVNVGVSGGTGQVALDNFVLQVATGIDQSSLQPVTVFPNPFSERITIQNILTGTDVEIDNLLGASVYHQKATAGNDVIGLDFLAPGIYILRINEGMEQRIIQLVKE